MGTAMDNYRYKLIEFVELYWFSDNVNDNVFVLIIYIFIVYILFK